MISRTTPPPAAPAPAAKLPPTDPAATARAPQPAAPPPEPGAETAPIRSGTIEARPAPGIAADPAAPGTTPGAVPPIGADPRAPGVDPRLPPGAVVTKTGPKGYKRPYSDAAVNEMRRADTPDATSAAPPVQVARAEPQVAAPAPAIAPSDNGAARSDDGFSWPATGKVVQSFSDTASKGIAIDGRPGDPVLAAADGRVIFSGNGPRGYGNLVIVKHENDLLSVYAHNRTLAVKEGQNVRRGQKIAELGDSGTDRPKLHFEIRQQGKPVDPMKYLPKR
ncbi:MAG TPA: peptidoglycan DD-metalloendopeptidase family protein [Burkholderiaceae bacterium]|nr:peptidoglycan DD-metalloendopeptidase family protein [Burkholderiaceae bacterium]